MEASPAGIAVVGAERSYGNVAVLRGVQLEVEPGECVALLGPSGCGKTTLLRTIAGLDPLDAGSIRIGAKFVSTPTTTVAPERRGVGMVFQDGALFPHLSVARNVGFGLPRAQRRSSPRIDALLELVGLGGLQDRLPEELSGGEAQRVALARALAPEPNVLLLDEPFSNLDTALRRRLRDDVRAIVREASVTTVFVTHDRDEAFRLGDRVAVMRDGVIVQVDRPDRLYRQPFDRWVADFLGDARWVDVDVRASHLDSPFGPLDVAGRDDGPAQLLVRPEDLVVIPPDDADPLAIEARVIDSTFAGSGWLVSLTSSVCGDLVVEVPGEQDAPARGSILRIRRREVAPVVVDRASSPECE